MLHLISATIAPGLRAKLASDLQAANQVPRPRGPPALPSRAPDRGSQKAGLCCSLLPERVAGQKAECGAGSPDEHVREEGRQEPQGGGRVHTRGTGHGPAVMARAQLASATAAPHRAACGLMPAVTRACTADFPSGSRCAPECERPRQSGEGLRLVSGLCFPRLPRCLHPSREVLTL